VLVCVINSCACWWPSLTKRAHAYCDPSDFTGCQPAVKRQKQHRYSILRPPTPGRCGSIAKLCASPPALVAPCCCAPTVLPSTRAILEDDWVRSAVVVIVVRDALTDHRIVECVSLWDICLCCGPSRTSVHRVRFYAPPSPQWSFGSNLSFRPLAFRVYLCLCVRVCARSLLQLRLWACLSHVSTYRCAVRFSFSAAAAPAHTLRAPLLASSPLLAF